MQLIKISDVEQLLDIKEISEKLFTISKALEVKFKEKKLFNKDPEFDIMDNVLEFFIEWCQEFATDISFKSVDDDIYISQSEQSMIKRMVLFYESEVNGIDKDFLENESESFREALFSLGIEVGEYCK